MHDAKSLHKNARLWSSFVFRTICRSSQYFPISFPPRNVSLQFFIMPAMLWSICLMPEWAGALPYAISVWAFKHHPPSIERGMPSLHADDVKTRKKRSPSKIILKNSPSTWCMLCQWTPREISIHFCLRVANEKAWKQDLLIVETIHPSTLIEPERIFRKNMTVIMRSVQPR